MPCTVKSIKRVMQADWCRYIQSIYAFTSEELGSGVSGTVRVVIDRYRFRWEGITSRATNERYALKTINLLGLSPAMRERVVNESLILARMHHKNIVKLYEIYESDSAVYLIMELLSGGELFSRLMAQPGTRVCAGVYSAEHKFSEEYACSIVNDMLNAICYLHNYKNIAHRDLKCDYFPPSPAD